MLLWLLCSAGFAQDDEIIIEAERSVVAARAALDAEVRDLGYVSGRQSGDTSRYIHPQIWRPRVRIYDDGLMEVRTWRRTPLMLAPLMPTQPLNPDEGSPLNLNDGLGWQQGTDSTGVNANGLSASDRTTHRMEADVLLAVNDSVRAWQDAIRERERLYRVEELREKMHTTWGSAQPPEDRRAEILSMWLNTTDNDDGERVREMIEVFIDDTIQPSATPLTDEEVDAANIKRTFERALAPAAPR